MKAGGGGGPKDGSDGYHPMTPTNNSKTPFIWGILGAGHPGGSKPSNRLMSMSRFMICLLISISLVYVVYTVSLFRTSSLSNSELPCSTTTTSAVTDPVLHLSSFNLSVPTTPPTTPPATNVATTRTASRAAAATGLQHVVFGIAASASLWNGRKDYIKLWWRPSQMRGFIWFDKPVKEFNNSASATGLPHLKISSDTASFPYTHKKGSRSAIRISRIVSETYRLGLDNVRWFVMGDDDTVFVPDNLVHVLSQFDHRQPYYIGSVSESHIQNIYFSYGMAYGGGGFAISRPLAAALARMQDRCLHRYPALYGSDDRIQACMAELGVPLTRHPGFHQFDVYGNLLGLLAAHPVAPLVSLHHLDVVEPIFPNAPSRSAALRRVFDGPVRLDSAAIFQQSICYEDGHLWTVFVSWGFAVQLVRGVISPREIEMPARTFLNWYRRADYTAYALNTRPVARHPCQKPFVYYLSSSRYDAARSTTVTVYERHRDVHPACRWKTDNPSAFVDRVVVYKKPDPSLWDRAPRRNCCRVVSSPKNAKKGNKTMTIDVGVCRDGEFSEI
ncbi:hypothetical protein COCNU_10G006070 [Cocos nucifera]|uniref:Uncharacterized protein n=1 Tax=Cocos nucifera TaxID=13894 RepID=A0A8K0INI9_COCNU|nr:hypothetical protein COCNU_10G006070 [Cocos nucifera]